MGSMEDAVNSGERLSFFKLFSEKQFKVEIPIIQRDYAQGRASEREVRTGFLNALYSYIEEGRPNRDLDFVYGSLFTSDGVRKFIPLDGQQRLTTLFLLHWYLAHLSGNAENFRRVMTKNKKSLFSYETRASSSEFCDALMASEVAMATLSATTQSNGMRLSELIRDSGWFYLSWNHDPTIQSMLTMLDAIHVRFFGNPEFYERLIDSENPVVTFLFLNFHTFGLTDDLYIKMNARGKPLTDFENFKAKFEQRIKSLGNIKPTHKLEFTENLVDDYEYFIHKIDTDWADIFWAYRNTSNNGGSFDEELMAFIGLLIANYRLVEGRRSSGGQRVGVDKFFGPGGRLISLSFQEYSDLECFTTSLIDHLIKMMDALYHGGLIEGRLNCYLESYDYYSEHDVFRKVIANSTSYPEKLRFYAFYIYLLKAQDEDGLVAWLRVIYNLTENTIINNAEEYRRALLSIDELSTKCELILEALIDGCEVSAFYPAQVLEERIKAALLQKSAEWSTCIVELEMHPFFKGQIGFAISFSGVLDFYRQNDSCDWNDEADREYRVAFSRYAGAGSQLFNLIKDGSSCINYLWERAVLSKGIYFTSLTADRWNILSKRLAKNNIERDHSWKRLLRIGVHPEPIWDSRQGFVKAVFDDPRFNQDAIEASLESICDAAISDESLVEWRRLFIEHAALFDECNQGFVVRQSGDVYLLSESQRNHYHSELYTLVLSWKLKGKNFSPFSLCQYVYVRSRDENPHVSLGHWWYEEAAYGMYIQYVSGKYEILFHTDTQEQYPQDLAALLESSDMEKADGYQTVVYSHFCDSPAEVSEYLAEFCTKVKNLADK